LSVNNIPGLGNHQELKSIRLMLMKSQSPRTRLHMKEATIGDKLGKIHPLNDIMFITAPS
jgi:hypothetical protein